MSEYLNKIVYLTEAQAQTLFNNGSITSGDKTISYNPNDLYITPENNIITKSTSEWDEENDFIPDYGTIVIYTNSNNKPAGIKIGDGINTIEDLPFIEAGSATKVNHTLTFGNGTYVYDGSADVTIPIYTGTII